jgi:signal transduction histidine kinase/ligand-binding sensor domain-containing protein
MTQDPYGYLWLGTENGLVRFDGVRFTSSAELGYRLPNTQLQALFSSGDGSLWVTFRDRAGVTRIRDGDVVNYAEAEGMNERSARVILESVDGSIWVGGARGLFRFNGDRWERVGPEHGLPLDPIYAAYIDSQGKLLVGTGHGVLRLTETHGRFQAVEGSPPFLVNSISQDRTGTIWITDTVTGFRRLDRARGPSEKVTANRLLHDRRGDLWVGTFGQGLWRVRHSDTNQAVIHRSDHSLDNFVLSLIEDREGSIWVGTTNGLSRLTPRKVTNVAYVGRVWSVDVTSDGTVWAGSDNEMIQISRQDRVLHSLRGGLQGSHMRTSHADENGVLWVATDRGLVRIENGRVSSDPLPGTSQLNRIISITSDAHGGVWLFDLDEGLVRWRGGQVTAHELPSSMKRDTALADYADIVSYTDKIGRLWFAVAGGELGVMTHDGKFDNYRTAHDSSMNGSPLSIYTIYEDNNHVLWAGANNGLNRLADGRIVPVTFTKSFPSERVTGIVEDTIGGVWLARASGFIRIEQTELVKTIADAAYRVPYNVYDASDGLTGMPVWRGSSRTVARAMDGRLLFITSTGLAVIEPRMTAQDWAPVVARIEGAFANEQRFEPVPNVVLPSRTPRLRIDYTALALARPTKMRFRYRLEGFDSDWIEAGARRQAFYTNLQPGRYRFNVIVSENNLWQQTGAIWDFSINAAFYQTSWFYAVCSMTLGVTVWMCWRLRLTILRHQFTRVLAERVRLSREIHDTLLQGLIGVALRCDAIAGDIDSSPQLVAGQLHRMRRQVENCVTEARYSIWGLRSPMFETGSLVSALRAVCERATENQPVSFGLTIRGTVRQLPSKMEEQLLRFAQEGITNAVRHSSAAHVDVVLEYNDELVRLRVSDQGCGFDPASYTAASGDHYGLTGMRERTEQIGGQFSLVTSPGNGTQVEMVVPSLA